MVTRLFYLSIGVSFLLFSCNPECDTLSGVHFTSFPLINGQQVLLESSTPNALINRDIFIDNVLAETEPMPGIGVIVHLPENVVGSNVEMRIEDADCQDIVRLDMNIRDQGFFENNALFIPPAPPDVIIPTPNPPAPPNINNAWISPNNTDYCIWFRVERVDNVNRKLWIITPELDSITQKQSIELSVQRLGFDNCTSPSEGSALYHGNLVFGLIDEDANHIQFWIDRGTNGVEEFEGRFIHVSDTPYDDGRIPECGGGWGEKKEHMMMVTSKQTNRPLILYQQL